MTGDGAITLTGRKILQNLSLSDLGTCRANEDTASPLQWRSHLMTPSQIFEKNNFFENILKIL